VRRATTLPPACSDCPEIWEFNPLNAELNSICHLLALLGAHHILHVSRIRVKLPETSWLFNRPGTVLICLYLLQFLHEMANVCNTAAAVCVCVCVLALSYLPVFH
jgi:hypothetical protein